MSVNAPPALLRPAENIAQIELRRPQFGNRIEAGDILVLESFLAQCETDRSIHAVVLTGSGKHFCSGFDLGGLSQPSPGDSFERLVNRLERLPCVTILAMNGIAVGGGSDIALACDLRLGTPSAAIMMPAAKFGLPLYPGAIGRYVSRLGLNHAKRLIMTAETMTAPELQTLGVLQGIVAPDELLPQTLELAAGISALPPRPLAAMKAALNAATNDLAGAEAARALLDAAFDITEISARIEAARAARRS